MPAYYPINLSLENKRCLVIGAGIVAERKVRRLLESDARISVISPVITPGFRALCKNKKIVFKKRKFSLKDLPGAYLVIAATNDRKVNAAVYAYCRKKGILVNVVDSPKECSFILPSVVRRGALTISISTDGISPALAKKIRQDLESKFGAEYAVLLRMMKQIRPRVLKKIKDLRSRKDFFQKVLKARVLDCLRRNKKQEAKIRLERILKNASVS
jgi:precorrin-2 dehydrogenase / sirohydrochlorin ferrochelatase